VGTLLVVPMTYGGENLHGQRWGGHKKAVAQGVGAAGEKSAPQKKQTKAKPTGVTRTREGALDIKEGLRGKSIKFFSHGGTRGVRLVLPEPPERRNRKLPKKKRKRKNVAKSFERVASRGFSE